MMRLRTCLCLGALLAAAASAQAQQSADWRDEHYVREAERSAPYKYQIERDGEYLRFRFSAGKRVVLVSSPDGCDGDECTSYFFREYVPKLDSYLVNVQYCESEKFLLIHRRSGLQTLLATYPNVDPSGQRFIAVLDSESEGSFMEMWRLTAEGPSLEFTYMPPQSYGFVAWRSPDDVQLVAKTDSSSEEPGTTLHLVRMGTGWRLVGAGIDVPMQAVKPTTP